MVWLVRVKMGRWKVKNCKWLHLDKINSILSSRFHLYQGRPILCRCILFCNCLQLSPSNGLHSFITDVELLNAIASGSPDVVRFLTIMAICNTVVPTRRWFCLYLWWDSQIWLLFGLKYLLIVIVLVSLDKEVIHFGFSCFLVLW